MNPSKTDIHWDTRATNTPKDADVNIGDIYQRELEYDYICKHLTPDMRVLEVGCGNGFSTERFSRYVKHIDAFDRSEEMIRTAGLRCINMARVCFFVDNILEPEHLLGPYDAVICVRVLINLANLQEQKQAIRNVSHLLKPGGRFVLAEGFLDGFATLNKLRLGVGLSLLRPAEINFYSSVKDLMPILGAIFVLEDEFHLGVYDYLTRVVYPLVSTEVKHNTEFSEKCLQLARQLNPGEFKKFSRLRGFVFRKR